MENSRIHAIGCSLSGTKTGAIVEQIAALKSLAFPIVCLPDIHVKDHTEGPSSFAAATEGTIVPDLTAPSVGCGMAVVRTNLTKNQVSDEFFEKFFRAMRQELGPNYGISKNFLLMLGVIKRPHKKYDLTDAELEAVLKDGAEAAVKKYNLPESMLDKIEYRGSMFTDEEKAQVNLYAIIPPIAFRSGKHNLGYGFKGNHFIEIQYVEEVLDDAAASSAGLKKDQIVIMYHGGGGAVPYHVGRFYGNRRKNTPK
ncbi:MAG: RtcB family protein, partial [Patescibacteria group bacterium]